MTDLPALYAELAPAIRAAGRGRAKARIEVLGIRCPLVGLLRVETEAGYWRSFDRGEPHLIYPVLVGSHICEAHNRERIMPTSAAGTPVGIVDTVAWRPDRPGVYLRCGSVWALGEWRACRWLGDGDDPLHLYDTPTAWLAASCAGAVILDWQAAAPELVAWPSIICNTLALAEKADETVKAERRRLTPKAPKVLVATG